LPTIDSAAIADIVAGGEALQVKARLIVEGALTGLHRARLHGSSVEFAEHKEYSPGDEVRHIDWKAYAKLDRYFVKQFEQESQLTAYLLLDASGSMDYRGDGLSKLDYAAYLLAALAYLLIRQQDKVGLAIFGDENLEGYVPPRARPAHLHDLLAALQDATKRGAGGAEPVTAALDRVGELARRRRSLIVLASDLFDSEGDAPTILRRLKAQGHDVVFFHVLDPHEIDFPFQGLTLFEALESDRKMLANPGAIRRHYKSEMSQFLARTRTACAGGGVDYQLVPTSTPLERALLDFLSQRAGASARRREGAWSS
jgi:uncharacterized protein (DUF58 family)